MRANLKNLFNNGMRQPLRTLNLILHIPQILRLVVRLFRDRRVALNLKILLVAAVIYAISPIDLIPDIAFPVVGYLDDIAVVILAMKYFLRNIPQEIIDEHVQHIDSKVANYK